MFPTIPKILLIVFSLSGDVATSNLYTMETCVEIDQTLMAQDTSSPSKRRDKIVSFSCFNKETGESESKGR